MVFAVKDLSEQATLNCLQELLAASLVFAVKDLLEQATLASLVFAVKDLLEQATLNCLQELLAASFYELDVTIRVSYADVITWRLWILYWDSILELQDVCVVLKLEFYIGNARCVCCV